MVNANSQKKSLYISDNFLTYCTRKVRRTTLDCYNFIKRRTIRRYDIDKFKDMPKNMNWSNIMESRDVDKAWNHFQSNFLQALLH